MKTTILPLLLGTISASAQMAFYPLGFLDATAGASEAYAVSANGARIAGYSTANFTDNLACWWTTAGITALPPYQDWHNNAATDISADASVTVGYNSWGGTEKAFYHIAGSNVLEIPMPPPPPPTAFFSNSFSWEVSDNGQVVVGSATYWKWFGVNKTYYARSFVWSPGQTTATLLPQRPGTFKSDAALGVNHDGSLIVGKVSTSTTTEAACYWTAAGGPFILGQATDVVQMLAANGVTPDGSVIVGSGYDTSTSKGVAFKWTAATGAVALPFPTTGSYAITGATAFSVSGDGRVVVGYGENAATEQEAIFWVDLQPYLLSTVAQANGVLPFDGNNYFEPFRAYGVDFYGNTICGYGKALSGKTEGFALILDTTPDPPAMVIPQVQPQGIAANGDFTVSWFARPGLRYRVKGGTNPSALSALNSWTDGQGLGQSYTATSASTGGASSYFLAVEVGP